MVSQAERRASTVEAIVSAAHALFAANGFAATSIDEIASRAGVAKGAVYHHFASKEEIFTRVLEGVHEAIADRPVPASALKITDPSEQIAMGVLRYLNAATEPGAKQILLIDGPAVLGWRKWREIDARFFGAKARAVIERLLGPAAKPREVDAISHLLLGAVMEAALVCATATDAKRKARELTQALRKLLSGPGAA
jgi:AcrR family transcriptional regulator